MGKNQLQTIDLNLLLALQALLEQRHISKAAAKLDVSQPAMSRHFVQLKRIFKDPLLVRDGRTYSLTPRAEGLRAPLGNVLLDMEALFTTPTFDPAQATGEIFIATRDYEMITLLPAFLKVVAAQAPGLRVSIVPLVEENFTLLENHSVDFILSAGQSNAAHLARSKILEDDHVCLASKNHPILKDKTTITLKQYVALRHGLVSLSGSGPGVIDRLLEKQSLERQVYIRVPQFMSAAYLVADSDLVVTVPRRMALVASGLLPLRIYEVPLKLEKFSMYLYWHVRQQKSGLHTWLRRQMGEVWEK
jgi:DNA-binding transcriptional LysR family regulator